MLEAVASVVSSTSNDRIALMLYGSVARGTSDNGSDVDVLEVVSRRARSYKVNEANVTQYTPAHLHAMAQQGSLFILHLVTDGIVLSDHNGVLATALDAYVSPVNYDPVWGQLAVVSGVTDTSASNIEAHVESLCRLGIYILRTAVYIRAIEYGAPTFDVDLASACLGEPGLQQALLLRRREQFSLKDLIEIRRLIMRVIPGSQSNTFGSVEGYAIANSTRPDLASLFSVILGGAQSINYSALSLPPF